MAESVVSFAVERLGDLLIEEAKFLHGVEDQVKDLQTELIRMQCFLEDAEAVKDKDKRVRNWVAEIRELAYRAENVLATYIFEVESRRRRLGRGFCGSVRRLACIFKEGIALHKVGSEIDSIKNEITRLSTSLQTYGIRDLGRGEGSSSAYEKLQMLRRTYSHVVEEDFVDFHGDTWKLVKDLVDEEKQFQAISICGIGGLGKTTLAKQVYRDATVRRHFDGFAWAYVSQQPKSDDILRGILASLMPEKKREEIVSMRYEELVKQVFETLKKKKCLVVLDDIWSEDDWNAMKPAFPTGGKDGSKILLTSRNKDVATYVDSSLVPHEPQLLNDEESWELFEKKIFTRGDHTESTITKDQRQELGKEMLERCGGLPLAIVVLGGVLAGKHTLDEWMTVHKNIDFYLTGDTVGVTKILALSYYALPYWLKPCFLYLGNYPEDYEILAHTLYQLWIAEGFISLNEGRRGKEETLMDVAERYLGELAQRSMVQVQIVKVEDCKTFFDRSFESFGRFKSCRLHDLMREMCLSMVKEENFLKVIDHGQSSERQSRSSFSSSSSSKIHRLAIHGNEHIDPSNLCIDQEKNIRGVLLFDGNKCTPRSRKEFVSHLPKNFKLARVMHLEEFGSGEGEKTFELPKAVGDLIHMRYFRLGGSFKLPSSIGNLRYLQTLDLSSVPDIIIPIIPNVLWNLKQLMHLYFPPDWTRVKCDKLRLDGLDNLEVLDKFYSRSFIVEDLHKLINLRSLTGVEIWGRQEDLEAFVNYLMSITLKQLLLRHCALRIAVIDFCTEDGQALLKQIFFECHPLHELMIIGRIRKLPEYQQSFHSSLTHLFLLGAKLEEDPMARLEKLSNLAALHLHKAYIGKEMVCSAKGFPRLKKLALMNLKHLEDWRVDEGAMPNLSHLEIWRCSKLKMVPNGLRSITILQELYIEGMPQAFVRRLKSPDGVDFDKVSHIPSIRVENTRPDSEGNEDYLETDNNEEYQVTSESSVEEL